MKNYIVILILIFGRLPTFADVTTTNTFIVNTATTVVITTSGTLSTNINAETGELGTGLNINYKITTNQALHDVRLKAVIVDDFNKEHSAFCSNGGNETNQNIYLVFASSEHPPTGDSINDCKLFASTPINNPDTIAYPGSIAINNNGSMSYNGDGYFSCKVGENTTDLSMSITTAPKSGTYDANTAMDEPDTYKVEIYLDNISE